MKKNEENTSFRIVIDTREQFPFRFCGYQCFTVQGTLHTGDYSLLGMEDKITLERKSIDDLASCMTVGRERFERELGRMRNFESAAVIVEEPLVSIRRGAYRSKLKASSFEQSILAFMIRYRIPFLFGKDRIHAEWLAFNCLRHYWNAATPEGKHIPYVPPPS